MKHDDNIHDELFEKYQKSIDLAKSAQEELEDNRNAVLVNIGMTIVENEYLNDIKWTAHFPFSNFYLVGNMTKALKHFFDKYSEPDVFRKYISLAKKGNVTMNLQLWSEEEVRIYFNKSDYEQSLHPLSIEELILDSKIKYENIDISKLNDALEKRDIELDKLIWLRDRLKG